VGTAIMGTTDAAGSYALSHVPSGTYQVQFRNGAYEELLPQVLCSAGPALFVGDQQQLFTIPTVNLIRAHRFFTADLDFLPPLFPRSTSGGIGFMYWGELAQGPGGSLAAVNGVTGATTTLFDQALSLPYLSLSQDQSRVVLYNTGADALHAAVLSVPVTGGAFATLGTSSDSFYPDFPPFTFSPDGKLMLFSEDGLNLWVAPVAGGTKVPLASAPGGTWNHDCWFTPLGGAVFCRGTTVSLAPINGGGATVITTTGASQESADLSADGMTVAFAATTGGATSLFLAPATGGAATRLTAALPGPVAFAPDGRIVYLSTQSTLEWIDANGATHGTIMPAVSAARVSFGGTNRVVADVGSNLMVGTFSGDPPLTVGPSAWSRFLTPDRNRLVAWDSNLGGMVTVSLSTGDVTTLGMMTAGATFSPDGSWVAFIEGTDIRLARTDGSMNRAIGQAGGVFEWTTQFSPASRSLLFNDNRGLWVMPVDGNPVGVALQGDIETWAGETSFTFFHYDTNAVTHFASGPYLGSVP
jgi:hypothetical protein